MGNGDADGDVGMVVEGYAVGRVAGVGFRHLQRQCGRLDAHIIDGDFNAIVRELLSDVATGFQQRVNFKINRQRKVRHVAERDLGHTLGDSFAHEIKRHEVIPERISRCSSVFAPRRRLFVRWLETFARLPRLLSGAWRRRSG